MNNVPDVRIYEGLNPSTSLIVLYLDDVGEDDRIIFRGDELQGSWVVIIFPVESSFCLGNGLFNRDRRCGGRDLSYISIRCFSRGSRHGIS